VEVEVPREERPARPLPVRVLSREQPRAESLGGDAGAGRHPRLLGRPDKIALDLPAQRRISVQQPGKKRRFELHLAQVV
jgi:hypothetical protein